MSNSATIIDQLATSQKSKEARINSLIDAASPSMIFGRQASGCNALTWAYYGGSFRRGDGVLVQLPNGTLTLSANLTNYIEVNGSGVVSKNTTGFSQNADPLYTVVCGAASVTSYTDHRTGMNAEVKQGKHVVTLAYSANLTVDWAEGYDVVRITATGNLALTFVGGADGQVMVFEITQGSGGNKSINLPGSVRYSADIPNFSPSTTAAKMDKLGFMCSGGSPSSYDLMAVLKGF